VIEMPKGMVVTEQEATPAADSGGDPYRSPGAVRERPGLTIRWPTARKGRWFMVLWSVIWWGGLIPLIASGKAPWWIVGHVIAGLLAIHETLRQYLNHATVTAADGTLSSWIAPIPPARRLTLQTRDIQQLHVVHVPGDGDTHETFVVHVRTARGDRVLVTFGTEQQARWLEQRLEHHLGLVDEPVPGELPKR
jgi:hypothetical protein